MSKVAKGSGKLTAIAPSPEAVAESQRAEWRIDYYTRHYEFSIDQVAGHSKWLSATLFVANAGGLLTLINQSNKIPHILLSGTFFVAGLVLALLSATANQEIYNRVSEPTGDMIAYWNEVKITGITNPEQHDKIAEDMAKVNKFMWIGPVFGWASGVSFIGGVIAIAYGLS